MMGEEEGPGIKRGSHDKKCGVNSGPTSNLGARKSSAKEFLKIGRRRSGSFCRQGNIDDANSTLRTFDAPKLPNKSDSSSFEKGMLCPSRSPCITLYVQYGSPCRSSNKIHSVRISEMFTLPARAGN